MKKNISLLIVDDEVDYANGLARLVQSSFPHVHIATRYSGDEALKLLRSALGGIDVMLLDLTMPGKYGMEVLRESLCINKYITVVILTAHGTIETAVTAVKEGAWDFLTKPVAKDTLIHCLTMAFQHHSLKQENQRLKKLVEKNTGTHAFIGEAPVMMRVKDAINAVAGSSYTVLIRGESGTGKEVAAESIHYASERASGPLVSINCPAIPESLLESELFGYVKGAFTGANGNHTGLFEQASGGTLLLDEIGDIPLSLQIKLLRVLQDGVVKPLGSNKAIRIDTRIVALTNQNLEQKIKEGLFREDLYYRLNVLSIVIPSLKERVEDIPLLAVHFLSKTCKELGIPAKSFSTRTLADLCQYTWPGNIRELQNVVRRMVVFTAGTVIDYASHMIAGQNVFAEPAAEVSSYKAAKQSVIDSFTQDYMKTILSITKGNISEAARISGIERVSLQKILRRIDLEAASFKD